MKITIEDNGQTLTFDSPSVSFKDIAHRVPGALAKLAALNFNDAHAVDLKTEHSNEMSRREARVKMAIKSLNLIRDTTKANRDKIKTAINWLEMTK